MVTGIYNLPQELCSAIGDALTEFIYNDNYEATYVRQVNDAFSILSEDSKIMIGEVEFGLFGGVLKITSVWAKVSSGESVSILCSPFITGLKLKAYLTVSAEKASPNTIIFNAWKEREI